MRRTFGPILTTGVALAAAGVVVANPIVAPHPDLRIPSVALSAGSDDAVGMLDQSFLDAIAPAAPDSNNPFSILKQLISSLAADATYLGKNAIIDAFVAGVTAVSEPDLTATSVPYLAPLAESPEMAMSVLPGIDISALVPVSEAPAPVIPALTSAVSDTVVPAVRSLVGSLINDAGYVSGEVLSAAFAVGAVVAAEPGLIGDTLQALVNGDFTGALESAVKVVIAPFGPPVIVLNALVTVVQKHLIALGLIPPLPTPDPADDDPDEQGTPTPVPVVGSPRGSAPVSPVDAVVGVPRPGAAVALDLRPRAVDSSARESANGRTDVADDVVNDVVNDVADDVTDTVSPVLSPVPSPLPPRTLRGAVQAAGDHAEAALSAALDAVGKVTARARGEKPAPSGS